MYSPVLFFGCFFLLLFLLFPMKSLHQVCLSLFIFFFTKELSLKDTSSKHCSTCTNNTNVHIVYSLSLCLERGTLSLSGLIHSVIRAPDCEMPELLTPRAASNEWHLKHRAAFIISLTFPKNTGVSDFVLTLIISDLSRTVFLEKAVLSVFVLKTKVCLKGPTKATTSKSVWSECY